MHALIGCSQRSAGTKKNLTQIRSHEDVEAQNLPCDTQYRRRLEGQGRKRVQGTEQTRHKSGCNQPHQGSCKIQELGQVVIHKKDMTIQTEHTYGKDPYPPKG